MHFTQTSFCKEIIIIIWIKKQGTKGLLFKKPKQLVKLIKLTSYRSITEVKQPRMRLANKLVTIRWKVALHGKTMCVQSKMGVPVAPQFAGPR